MRQLDTATALRCASNAVPLLLMLEREERTMTYAEFAQRIGLTDVWHVKWKDPVGRVLDIAVAASKFVGEPTLDHKRVVAAETGEPGQGAARVVTIERVAP